MCYLWQISNEYPSEFIGEYERTSSPDRFLFTRGDRLRDLKGTPCFKFNATARQLLAYDGLPNNAMVPLVENKIAAFLLDLCPNDVQLIDTQVFAKDQQLNDYKLVIATHLVSCVNHEDSEYVFIRNTDAIMKFKRLRLKPDGMGSRHLARESEYKSYLYVSQQIKDAFDSHDWRGYTFSPPESVHP